ncbi:MAG: metalloregulator ArsR/SmtB family transcription factor [Acidimicrobiia bacterium]|nr:MAG: metalloregulator ArsR/SmtB family transcription factor [Acidimicrobiia bacterium]
MDVFTAVADPTRRSIVEMLAHGELEAGAIAERFDISRPAVSRHLRLLRESSLVCARKDGRRRLYRLEGHALTEVADWAERQRVFWSDRLDALERHLEEEEERA